MRHDVVKFHLGGAVARVPVAVVPEQSDEPLSPYSGRLPHPPDLAYFLIGSISRVGGWSRTLRIGLGLLHRRIQKGAGVGYIDIWW